MQEITTSLQDAVKIEIIRPNEKAQATDTSGAEARKETETKYGPDVVVDISDSAKEAQSAAETSKTITSRAVENVTGGEYTQEASQVSTPGEAQDTNKTAAADEPKEDKPKEEKSEPNKDLEESIVKA
ncbi:MAG: hypothetical protein L3V56_00970 [Candidatus Magnetoovum sp. WYHC-5]|nr:hypothetical protein [Candidatus Magnetoovum sp. WYHC-5]